MRRIRWILGTALALAALLGATRVSFAHEIPAAVTVQSYIRAEGDVLRMLVRVPLGSMRDIQFPLRGPGYIMIEEADLYLRDAAVLWLVDYLQLFENDELLERPGVAGTRISLPSNRAFVSFDSALDHILGTPSHPRRT